MFFITVLKRFFFPELWLIIYVMYKNTLLLPIAYKPIYTIHIVVHLRKLINQLCKYLQHIDVPLNRKLNYSKLV